MDTLVIWRGRTTFICKGAIRISLPFSLFSSSETEDKIEINSTVIHI